MFFAFFRDNISSVCQFEYKTEDVFVVLSRKLQAARRLVLKVCAVAGVWFIRPVKCHGPAPSALLPANQGQENMNISIQIVVYNSVFEH